MTRLPPTNICPTNPKPHGPKVQHHLEFNSSDTGWMEEEEGNFCRSCSPETQRSPALNKSCRSSRCIYKNIISYSY